VQREALDMPEASSKTMKRRDEKVKSSQKPHQNVKAGAKGGLCEHVSLGGLRGLPLPWDGLADGQSSILLDWD